MTLFADVIIPLPLNKHYCYQIPEAFVDQVQIGARVVVQFGSKKILTAIVVKIHEEAPTHYEAKEILECLDEVPLVKVQQIQLMDWIAEYYMCTIGEVLNIALPSGLKISSQSKIQLNPHASYLESVLTDKEKNLLDYLSQHESISYEEAAEVLEVKSIYKILKKLIDKQLILVYEEVKEKFQPKVLKKIRLTPEYTSKEALNQLLNTLEKKPKQADILMAYLQKVPIYQSISHNKDGLAKNSFLKESNLSEGSLKTLLKNQIFEEFEIIVSRFNDDDLDLSTKEVKLSAAQSRAFEELMDSLSEKEISLFYGITGSGKTEIYIELIRRVLAGGSQVLYLLPEIALTTQIVLRLRKFFGNRMGVYHSKFSDNERVEVWQGVVSGKYSFVVGVRSAIFLPFDNLALLIVDEEHETSYKQQDPAPRYNARDVAIMMSSMQQCKVVLGSATPSFESYFQAKQGRYGLVKLMERFGTAELPEIQLVNLKQAQKDKEVKNHFSNVLLLGIEERLQKKEQVILFQNRRGYAPFITCRVCAWIPKCQNCAVSLTYHLSNRELRCHYCGYTEKPPTICPACHSNELETVGLGTEQIEDDLKVYLPSARLQRMDFDSTRQKNSYQKIIQDFENRNIDVLIGTQMVSKGLDFDHVSLVGIFDVDRLIHFPEFRASERTFQIITQVSGRAGRKDKKGTVIIQTRNPAEPILTKIVQRDYDGLYDFEINEREIYDYPPFSRLIKLIIKHAERSTCEKAAILLADKLRSAINQIPILGPEMPRVNRIRNKFIYNIYIKIPRTYKQLRSIKQLLRNKIDMITTLKDFKGIQIIADVDPV